MLVLIIIISAASGGSSTKSASPSANAAPSIAATKSPSHPAAAKPAPALSAAAKYIQNHGADANRVQANIELVLLALVQAKKTNDLNAVAQAAQTAHDNLDNIRNDFADTATIPCSSCSLDDASLELFTAANDLKNSMGALVAYTGDPNPATLAHFTSQYQRSVSEWDQGVKLIWAGRANKPTI